MKIYTRKGDTGETGLFGGGRVPKDDSRVTAYGTVDELNSCMGAVMAAEPVGFERELFESVQRDLFAIGGQLASPDPAKVAKALEKAELGPARVAELEDAIDRADRELPLLDSFVLPGGTTKAALLHVARTVCRRAERSVVSLDREVGAPPVILSYLNRLSDLLFTMARLVNHRAETQDRTW